MAGGNQEGMQVNAELKQATDRVVSAAMALAEARAAVECPNCKQKDEQIRGLHVALKTWQDMWSMKNAQYRALRNKGDA